LEHSIVCLKYYPCRISVNGQLFESVWKKAKDSEAVFFSKDHCDGFIDKKSWGSPAVTLLCKYQHLMWLPIPTLTTGGHDMTHDLRDYHRRKVPFLPAVDVTLNCNNLNVTISRDSFLLDSAYRDMIKVLARHLLLYLGRSLDNQTSKSLIIANQYILRGEIKSYLKQDAKGETNSVQSEEDVVIRRLAMAKVYSLSGHNSMYSLMDMKKMLSRDIPLFFSPEQTNIRWLGGAFKHDFIVLPSQVSIGNGAPDFYDSLFTEVFGDVVNLDKIIGDNDKIKKLVDRGIAVKSALSPKCKLIGERKLTNEEQQLLRKIDNILKHEKVKHAILRNICIRFRKIHTVFFDLEEQGAVLATGLFNEAGKALEEAAYSNLSTDKDKKNVPYDDEDQTILLGLCRDNPSIQHLIESENPHKAYFALTFLAYQLALCQKMLVPYSPFYHVTAQKLAADMRKALIEELLADG